MWKHILEGFADPVSSQLSLARRAAPGWGRLLAEAGLLLGFALVSSWLVCR